MFDLEKLIAAASNLEPLPLSATRLARLVSREDSDVKEIEEVISFDQALTANILHAANSAASASVTPIVHIKDAVLRMGLGTVLALSVARSVKKQITQAIPVYNLSEGYLWKHSVSAALSTEVIQAFCPIRLPAESFTAALLHDIGKLILSRYLDAETRILLQKARKNEASLLSEIETELLGVHHGEVGGLVAQHWKLPDPIIRGITYHHYPESGGAVICYVVAVADIIAKQLDTKEDIPTLFNNNSHLFEKLRINSHNFERICGLVASRYESLRQKYN